MSQNLYAKARKIAQEAVKADDSNNHKEAYRLYLQSAEILLELTKFTENPQLSKIYENRAKEYIGRAKTLNKLIKTQIPNNSSKNPSSSEENSEYDKVLESSIVSETPDLTLDDVAGLEDVKRSLREAIVLPLKRPDLFTGSRQPWRGILLHGPPGCGKTMIAKATAGDIKATFFNISAAVLVSKWLGESEKLVKRLYELAKEKQPSIIFIDEVDSLTQSRSENENDAMRRVKTQLLSSMEGISSNNDDRVVTIGATNVPWEIDSAFRRRFQRRIYVPLPDEKARKIIFEINSKGIELDKSIDFMKLSKITNDYTGSDIANICREAIMAPIRELDSTNMIDDSSIKAREVTHNDYTTALKNVNKSVSKQELIKFIEWDKEFGAG